MSYGLVTRAMNAPVGVTQANRFGQTRAYLPLSQFFLQQGGAAPKGNQKGKVLTGKQAIPEPDEGEQEPKPKGKKGNKGKAKGEAMVEQAEPKRKAEEKGNPFALLFAEAKKHPEFGGWRLLGIDDEVEICENCGKRGLKRTMVIEPTDGDGGILHVGTTCGEILTGCKGSWLMKRAEKVQREKDQAMASSERSEIIKRLVASKFWKLHQNLWMYYLNNVVKRGLEYDERQKRSARRTMANLLRDTGLKADAIKGYFRSKIEPKWHKHLDDWYAIALGKAEATAGLTVFKSGAAGPAAGMTGSGNIPAVAVPIGAGDGGWDAIDAPGRKRSKKKKRKKGEELSKGVDYLLRMPW